MRLNICLHASGNSTNRLPYHINSARGSDAPNYNSFQRPHFARVHYARHARYEYARRAWRPLYLNLDPQTRIASTPSNMYGQTAGDLARATFQTSLRLHMLQPVLTWSTSLLRLLSGRRPYLHVCMKPSGQTIDLMTGSLTDQTLVNLTGKLKMFAEICRDSENITSC